MKDSTQLLAAYQGERSESAFAELVSRYVNLVYSVALRQMNGDVHAAQDVVQTVFADLAAKASTLGKHCQLGGWLHRHTCFVASKLRRSEQRRREREEQAATMKAMRNEGTETWTRVAEELDEAIDGLDSPDRLAVIMRFFERYSHRQIATALATTEAAAQKRVSRALEKLRSRLVQQGVTLSVPALISLLDEHGLASVPTDFESAVTRAVSPPGDSARSPAPQGGAAKNWWPTLGMTGLAAAIVALLLMTIGGDDDGLFNEEPSPSNANGAVRGGDLVNNALPLPPGRRSPGAIMASSSSGEAEDVMMLTVVSAESGRPLPRVQIKVAARLFGAYSTDEYVTDSSGQAKIAVSPEDSKSIRLRLAAPGFARTQLMWYPPNGQVVPETYELVMEKAVVLGGRVVTEEGTPVNDAVVSLLPSPERRAQMKVLSYHSDRLLATTNSEGWWESDEAGKEMIPRLLVKASHDAYIASSLLSGARDRGDFEAMKRGEHVFVLRSGVRMTGRVVDSLGAPVDGARLRLAGPERSSKWFQAEANGTFEVDGCIPGESQLVVTSRGYRSQTVPVVVKPDAPEVVVTLEMGDPLKIRVVDSNGEPIAGARIATEDKKANRRNRSRFREAVQDIQFKALPPDERAKRLQALLNSELKAPPPVPSLPRVSFMRLADEDGYIQWDEAPEGEILLSASAEGFISKHQIEVSAEERSVSVQLYPALVITGEVRDELSRNLLPSVGVRLGIMERPFLRPDAPLEFRAMAGNPRRFEGGSYHYSFETGLFLDPGQTSVWAQFEAVGYKTAVSREIRLDEGVTTVDVDLEPIESRAERVFVVGPDGIPAEGAEVVLGSPTSMVELQPSGLVLVNALAEDRMVETQSDGSFLLPSEVRFQHLVIAHKDGFLRGELKSFDLGSPLTLEAWGSLKGHFAGAGDEDMPGVVEAKTFPRERRQSSRFSFGGFTTEVDEDGSFEFSRLPAGRHVLWRPRSAADDENVPANGRMIQRFEIRAGEVTSMVVE